ncbi:ParB/RepB/Spo0J family partition protein [Xylanivirga thermophila]|uniref:ParB/RepB/Spo0J family partition protein n=1 Tax=Xylanivirga thermophila TaxID=2496273 RepID=UPI00101C49E0|nr:ParB/RepB/Spo0J family partition protein [Xylanivirga thermophila]
MNKRALGRGLDALIPSFDTESNQALYNTDDGQAVVEIKIFQIDPNMDQPRRQFDQDKIKELAQSIKKYGVVQPVIVKPKGNRYLLIAGERRWRAAQLAGLPTIPAIVKNLDEKDIMAISLIENLQREDLNPIEQALGIKKLIDEYNLTQEQVADEIGKSRSAVTNILRLLTLSGEIQKFIMDGKLTPGHGRAILGLEDPNMRLQIAKKVIEDELNVRDTERLIKKIKTNMGNREKPITKTKPSYIIEIESNLEECLGTKVNITPGKKKGVIQIEYYNNDDLERIMSKIGS